MPDSSAESSSASYAEIYRIFNNLVFDNDTGDIDDLTPQEENLYHRVHAFIEEQRNLSAHIPSPPKQLIALMQELEKEETDFDCVHAIVKDDLGLLGEIIKVSNSPLYRPRCGEITSLDKAISMLGLEGVMKVASVVMMRSVVDIDKARYKLYAKRQWDYCLKCAEACQLLSEQPDAFSNYLLGLLHNIGSVVIFSCFTEQSEDTERGELNDLKIIQRIMMEQSAWLSTLVAGEWQLPEYYLDSLQEFEKLVKGQLDPEAYAVRGEATRILETASEITQIHILISQGALDRDTGLAGLEELGIDCELVEKLFTRFELAEASLS